MPVIRRTAEFDEWLFGLTDLVGKARILKRLERVAAGNLGDCGSVGDSVSEMRMFFGPGYRVYFTATAEATIVLLWGGDKTTQGRDIGKAKEIAAGL